MNKYEVAWTMAAFIVLAIYSLPSAIAFGRHHPNRVAVLIINTFLGWMFIGWVVALAMALWGFEPKTRRHWPL